MGNNGIEVLIIKYTLGTCFAVVFIVFGVKMFILLGAVAKVKLIEALAGHEMLAKALEKFFTLKGVFLK